MKFRFAQISTFKAPVTIMTPGGDEQKFVAEFLYLDDKANSEAVLLGNEELLRLVWKGWNDEIVDADDKPLPFSTEQRELFLKHSFITNAVVSDYVRARLGIRAKN